MQLNTNLNRVMEAETIQKNEASLNSLISRRNFLLFGMLLLIVSMVTILFNSCTRTSISLDKKNLALNKGETYTLTATVKHDNTTNKTVSWTSSNTSKVTVDNRGKVTAKEVGEATITAKVGDKTVICTVVVPEIAVQSITLNQTSLELFIGNFGSIGSPTCGYRYFEATVKPDNATNKAVTWISSNTSVAEVIETGSPKLPYVYVRGKGTATITAKAGDKTATCTVNVLDIKLDKCEIELVVGEEYTLNATTNPGGQPVTWTSSSTSNATVEGDYGQGKVIAKASGTLTINATYQEQTVSCNINVYDVPLSGVTIEGVTWAAQNINAPGTFVEKVSDGGMFYRWNVKTGYPANQWMYTNATGTEWSSENDPCPSGWSIPTLNEVQTMLSKVINSDYKNKGRLAIVNGQQCVVMKFENNQHLVFRREHSTFYYFHANYWTSTPYGSDRAYCYTSHEIDTSVRSNMMRIRCVKK